MTVLHQADCAIMVLIMKIMYFNDTRSVRIIYWTKNIDIDDKPWVEVTLAENKLSLWLQKVYLNRFLAFNA